MNRAERRATKSKRSHQHEWVAKQFSTSAATSSGAACSICGAVKPHV